MHGELVAWTADSTAETGLRTRTTESPLDVVVIVDVMMCRFIHTKLLIILKN